MTTMTKPTKPCMEPEDVKEAMATLYSLRKELPDVVLEPIEEMVFEYRATLRGWRDGDGDAPDWNAFRDWINEICVEAEMPPLVTSQAPHENNLSNDTKE
jgi:hypothetical protein